MAKVKKEKKEKPAIKLDAQMKVALDSFIAACKSEDAAANARADKLNDVADAAIAWLKANGEERLSEYRALVRGYLKEHYPDSSARGRLTMVFRIAKECYEGKTTRSGLKRKYKARSTRVDALYDAMPKNGSNGRPKPADTERPGKATAGLALSKKTDEALTANDRARLTMLAKGLAKGDARVIARAIADITAGLDDVGRQMVKQAVNAAC